MDHAYAYRELRARMREAARLGSIRNLLDWDMQTVMPAAGQGFRAEQAGFLAGEIHRRVADPAVGELLDAVEEAYSDPGDLSPQAANTRHWRRAFDRASRVPEELQTAIAKAGAAGQAVWARARGQNDWGLFAPSMEEMVGLKRQEADALDYADEPYDALLDEFEPGLTTRKLEAVFPQLARELPPIVRQALELSTGTPAVLDRILPAERIEAFAVLTARTIGYDFQAGRLDFSAHPFSMEIGPGDVRITTRIEPDGLSSALFATIHETGHALYSAGLPTEHWGEPAGQALSTALHESQSRLWENHVGRSTGFWRHFHPLLLETIPELAGVSLQSLLHAVNAVRPGFIRVEADEASYNLHVLLRFELERALFRGEVGVRDLPGAWNERTRQLLGNPPPDDARGVLQDVHWSMGYFGYFPTYTLGNLYAAQLFETARTAFPDMEERFSRGDFSFLLSWLRDTIHSQGARFDGADLIERVTGRPCGADSFLEHLRDKYLGGSFS